MGNDAEKMEVENINTPGKVSRVDKAKYTAMRRALLKVLPKDEAGISVKEAKEKLLPHLPDALFPNGAKAGWWLKAVQLDLEAKRLVHRTETKPIRLYKD